MKNLNEKITKNFSYTEFIKSSTSLRFNIDNIPKDDYIWNNITDLTINCLQPIRDYFGGIRILSGYRCPLLNATIGGSKNSNHCFGLAADIEPIDSKIRLIDILNWTYNNINFKELILEYPPEGWIHIAYQKDNNKKILKLKDRYNNYDVVDIDYMNKSYKNLC